MGEHRHKKPFTGSEPLPEFVHRKREERLPIVRRFKAAIGQPNETQRIDGQEIQIRDDLGILVDPKALASPDCTNCRGQGLVVRLRPCTDRQVKELLATDPRAKDSLIFRCPHDRLLKDACRKCGRPVNRYVNRDFGRGAVFQSVVKCGCAEQNHRQLRKELLDEKGAHYSGQIIGAMSLQQQVKHFEVSARCQHDRPLREPCQDCGREKGVSVELKVRS